MPRAHPAQGFGYALRLSRMGSGVKLASGWHHDLTSFEHDTTFVVEGSKSLCPPSGFGWASFFGQGRAANWIAQALQLAQTYAPHRLSDIYLKWGSRSSRGSLRIVPDNLCTSWAAFHQACRSALQLEGRSQNEQALLRFSSIPSL